MPNLVVVEDEHLLGKSLRDGLRAQGYDATWFTSGEEFLTWLKDRQADLALLDLRLPGMDGLSVLEHLHAEHPEMLTVFMTAHGDVATAVRAMKLGAFEFLTKPVDLDALLLVVDRALNHRRLTSIVERQKRQEAAQYGLGAIIGQCPALEQAKTVVRRLAQLGASIRESPPTVLITGETGTGKDLVARAIHQEGPRADKPFVHVNCAALPEALIESELFGHVKGAFTDARQSKQGLFELASGGTLFLDEVGTLPAPLQAKLLTSIETRKIRPVGGVQERPIDIHLLSATNQKIEEAVMEGEFRQDLYHRLRVLLIELPPLRNRGDDIFLLADFFLKRLCARFKMPLKKLTPEARESLLRYAWPGNVRELSNMLESAVLQADGDVEVQHLPAPSGRDRAVRLRGGDEFRVDIDFTRGPVPLEQVERQLLERALAETRGNVTRAAELLDLSRDTMRYRIAKFELEARPHEAKP